MGIDIRLPNITGPSDHERLAQMQSYLYQFVEQLQWALQNVDTTSAAVATPVPKSLLPSGIATTPDPQSTFNSIKSLIIKSADIVSAYYQEISRRLDGQYVAQSDFGDFAQKTTQTITENSESTAQRFENIQVIITALGGDIETVEGSLETIGADLQETKTATNERIDDTNGSVANLGTGLNDANSRIADVDQDLQEAKANISENIQGVRDSVTGVNALLEDAKAQLQGSLEDLEVYITGLQNVIIGVTAYLKSGLLYYTDAGIPVYGLEIGQSVKDEISGEEVFNKYARFTSEKLSFYDNNGNEVAYISDKKLFIRIAEITVAFKIGGLISLVMPNGDVVEKWVGG